MGWNNLPDMVMTSDNSDMSDTDGMELLDEFYEQNHIISNVEYAKLKLSNFAVKILKTETNNSSIQHRSHVLMYFTKLLKDYR